MHSTSAPIISVIIPAYNAAKSIRETLESVFQQSYRGFEVFLINDGSQDVKELESAIAPFRHLIVYLSQPNRGPGAARNAGIRRASGEYLAFLDADDAWYPTCLETQLQLALNGNDACDLVYADLLLKGAGPRLERHALRYSDVCPSSGVLTFESLIKEECQASTSSTMVRRQVALDAGLFDENLRRAEDFDFWLRIAHRGGRLAYQRTVVGERRLGFGSLSTDNIGMLEALAQVLRKTEVTLRLSEEQRRTLKVKLRHTEALVNLERGKAQILDGDYGCALSSLEMAATVFNTNKLKLAIAGLRLAPRLMRRLMRTTRDFSGRANRSLRGRDWA